MSRQNPIAVAGRLADYEHGRVSFAAVDGLMVLARLDFDSLTGLEGVYVMFDFKRQFAAQAIEELAAVDVMMPYFTGPRRHSFFDDA